MWHANDFTEDRKTAPLLLSGLCVHEGLDLRNDFFDPGRHCFRFTQPVITLEPEDNIMPVAPWIGDIHREYRSVCSHASPKIKFMQLATRFDQVGELEVFLCRHREIKQFVCLWYSCLL